MDSVVLGLPVVLKNGLVQGMWCLFRRACLMVSEKQKGLPGSIFGLTRANDNDGLWATQGRVA